MSWYHSIKTRVWEIVEKSAPGDFASLAFDLFIIFLIIVNVIFVVLETVPAIKSRWAPFFRWFEYFSVSVFSIEYILRLWSCTSDAKFNGVIRGRVKFILTPLAILDLLAILPFYLPALFPCDLRILRALRLFRLLRMLKLARYYDAMGNIVQVLYDKKEELLLSFFYIGIVLIISATLMYYFENQVQPDKFSSIPSAIWWGICTITTVGYGDIYPVTAMGKILGGIIAILGIALFALPTGIIASGLSARIMKRETRKIVCPYCGKELEQ